MTEYGQYLYGWAGWLTQFILAFGGLAAVIGAVFRRRNRWLITRRSWRSREVPEWFLALWRADRESLALHERRLWLSGCGLRVDPRVYLACRRLIITAGGAISILCAGAHLMGWMPLSPLIRVILLTGMPAAGAYFDGIALNALRRYRTERIRRELVAVGRQLLYYTGSRLHLHGKLMRCLPHTRMIRGELSLLLNEWYHDPDRALQRFKERLGADEAYGFVESIRSLRQHESEDVYDLLREMVREYKAKIELAKEGRKETASYLLFVLAGVPILYTFQVFLYPWVQEAARLFDALNP